MRPSALIALLLAACTPGPSGPPGDDSDPPPQDTEPPTTLPTGDMGSLVLVRKQLPGGERRVVLHGLFVDEHPGWLNAATCAITGSPCISALPHEEDDWLDLDEGRVFQPEHSEFRYLGLDVALGEWRAHYVNGPDFPFYFANITEDYGEGRQRGWFGARLGGQWGSYEGDRDLYVSGDLDLIRPRPFTHHRVHDGQRLKIEWRPEGTGPVLLKIKEVGIGAKLKRLYLLEDDGYFELPVDDLGLGTLERRLAFTLTRWDLATVQAGPHTLDLAATSEVSWTADYLHVGGREELRVSDTCEVARTAPALEPGRYWGELADRGFDDDLWNTWTCTNGANSYAEDGMIRVELAPRELLTVSYHLPDGDAAIYLVTDCFDAATCVAGSNDTWYYDPEHLTWFNDTDTLQVLYLVLDAAWSSPGLFHLDVDIQPLDPPEMYDTCAEAQQQSAPLARGAYFAESFPFANHIDPTPAGCTGTSLPGPDSLTRVQLRPGETLVAHIDMPGSDPALYLLFNCNNGLSCPAGADVSMGPEETLIYTNPSGATENLYLVVDTKGGRLQPYFLTLDIR